MSAVRKIIKSGFHAVKKTLYPWWNALLRLLHCKKKKIQIHNRCAAFFLKHWLSLSLRIKKLTKLNFCVAGQQEGKKKKMMPFSSIDSNLCYTRFFAQCSSYHNYVSNKCCSKCMQLYIFKNCNRVHIVPCISSFSIYLWHKHDGPHLTLDCWPQYVLLKGLCKNRKFYTVVLTLWALINVPFTSSSCKEWAEVRAVEG